MKESPLDGDVRALTDRAGEYRKRVGNWRIFFSLNKECTEVFIKIISRRTSKTY